ncbi:MAG: hypothetical protein JO142_11280, partial [Burkholderiales bacterium]|nr:hypothetical protein [Burkholderiales bacterium]
MHSFFLNSTTELNPLHGKLRYCSHTSNQNGQIKQQSLRMEEMLAFPIKSLPYGPRIVLASVFALLTINSSAQPLKVVVERKIDGKVIRLDVTQQIISVSMPDPIVYGSGSGSSETRLLSALPRQADNATVSAAVLLQKAKQFDDGLYAAVEIATEQGLGNFPGKAAFLQKLAGLIKHEPPSKATDYVTAAAIESGLPLQSL